MASDSDHNPTPPPLVELDEQARAFFDATDQRVQAMKERDRRRRTRTLTVLSTLLVLALIAAGVAVWQQHQASGAQRLAIARGMVAQAERIRDQDPRGALQFGVAAEQLDDSPQTHASLLQTLESTPHFKTLTGHTDEVHGVAFAPDRHTLATTSTDHTIRLWDLPYLEGFHGDEVQEACLRAGGALDNPTWDQYAPGVNYQDTCANR